MARVIGRTLPVFIALAVVAGLVIADDSAPATPSLSGTLSAPHHTELKLGLEAYSGEVRLTTLIAPGTIVAKDDVIVAYELVDADKALEDAEKSAMLANLALEHANESLRRHAQSLPHNLQKAERALERAEEALTHFREVERAQRIRNGEINLTATENSIQDQKEELDQLERLYQGNDLAKESQDIVLNRARRRLAVTEERHEMDKASHERMVEVILPRRDQDLEAAVVDARQELERLKHASEHGNHELINRQHRAEAAAKEANERLANLRKELTRSRVLAPHAGVLVLGTLGGNNGVAARHRTGDKVAADAVIATVVDSARLEITVQVSPGARGAFRPGTEVHVRNEELGGSATGRVVALSGIVVEGKLSVRIAVNNESGSLLPGASATVTTE
jgi:hypothetical protein